MRTNNARRYILVKVIFNANNFMFLEFACFCDLDVLNLLKVEEQISKILMEHDQPSCLILKS